MRNTVPIVLILLAAAAGWWLLAGADTELDTPTYESDGELGTSARGEGLQARQLEAEGLSVKGRERSPKRKHIVVPDPRTLPKGDLQVTLRGPDLSALDSGAMQVFIEPASYAAWRTRLPLYDKDERRWVAKGVVAGPVRVRVQGDHIIGRSVTTVVKRDRDNELFVDVDLAGAIQYDVIAYDKKRPPKVKLTLYDYRDQPVSAWYQERTSRRLTSPKTYATAEIGPEGVVFGILPGRYRLRVVSAFEEYDEAEVDIVAGKTARVSLVVRR